MRFLLRHRHFEHAAEAEQPCRHPRFRYLPDSDTNRASHGIGTQKLCGLYSAARDQEGASHTVRTRLTQPRRGGGERPPLPAPRQVSKDRPLWAIPTITITHLLSRLAQPQPRLLALLSPPNLWQIYEPDPDHRPRLKFHQHVLVSHRLLVPFACGPVLAPPNLSLSSSPATEPGPGVAFFTLADG